jgi:hypothetical protein
MVERQLPKLCVGAARSSRLPACELGPFRHHGPAHLDKLIAVVISHRLVAGRIVEREFVLARLLGSVRVRAFFSKDHALSPRGTYRSGLDGNLQNGFGTS